jgi:hypothetical protein
MKRVLPVWQQSTWIRGTKMQLFWMGALKHGEMPDIREQSVNTLAFLKQSLLMTNPCWAFP